MDKALKQRLLGAAVVIALVVIVVPELVREPAQTVQSQPLLENNLQPMRADEEEPAGAGGVVERMVISLPGQEELREPGEPLDQPHDMPLPAVQIRALPQTPRLAGADTTGVDDESQPRAAVAVAIESPFEGDLQPMPDGISPRVDSLPLGEPDEAESVAVSSTPPAVSTARQQAAAEAAVKLRRHEIQRNRRIALARAEMADERQRDAETLAAQRARATREAQAQQQTTQRQTAAREARQRVAASPSARQSGGSAALPPVKLIAQPEDRPGGSSRWTVQVGSFSRADYANQQRDRLVAQEFPAVVRPATVNGQTLFRVQVGLQDSRNASEQMRLRVRQQLGINSAAVMPLDG